MAICFRRYYKRTQLRAARLPGRSVLLASAQVGPSSICVIYWRLSLKTYHTRNTRCPAARYTSASCKRVAAAPFLDARPCLQQLAEEAAFTPYGTSTAAAIVACCLYFVFLCCAIANYVYTKYPFYDVLIISTACKSLTFATLHLHAHLFVEVTCFSNKTYCTTKPYPGSVSLQDLRSSLTQVLK